MCNVHRSKRTKCIAQEDFSLGNLLSGMNIFMARKQRHDNVNEMTIKHFE